LIEFALNIRQSCRAFGISETCYRDEAKLSDENAENADWLVSLTQWQRNWGFGLYFLYLRNVKGFGWNHKRVSRIYRELALNVRIKPKKRLVREKPEALAAPQGSIKPGRWVSCKISWPTGAFIGCSTLSMTTTAKGLVLKLTSRC